MGDVEHDICDFCKKHKPVERTYLKPSKYKKPIRGMWKLYNEGDYFVIIRTCNKCGKPKIDD